MGMENTTTAANIPALNSLHLAANRTDAGYTVIVGIVTKVHGAGEVDLEQALSFNEEDDIDNGPCNAYHVTSDMELSDRVRDYLAQVWAENVPAMLEDHAAEMERRAREARRCLARVNRALDNF